MVVLSVARCDIKVFVDYRALDFALDRVRTRWAGKAVDLLAGRPAVHPPLNEARHPRRAPRRLPDVWRGGLKGPWPRRGAILPP
jgi:hypothetical protein